MDWLVVLLLAGYTALMVRHAAAGRRRTRDVTDFYVGGRSMGGVALGLSFFATYSSTNSFVGFSGQAYTYGIGWLLLAPAAVVFTLLAWSWVAPRLRLFTASLDSVTIPDFIGFRFNSRPARVSAALIVVAASTLYMTAVFKGVGNILEAFLGIPYPAAIGLVFVIVLFYTAAGGFISVVRTDVVQGILMIFAALFLFAGTVSAAGGLGALGTLGNSPTAGSLFRWDAAMPFAVLIGIVVATTMKMLVEPRQLSRFYALESERAVRQGMWVSTLAFLGVYLMLVPIGLYARVVLGDGLADTDLVVPTLVSAGTVFSPLVASFLVVAMIAAAMSSLDSVLLVTASTCQRDLVESWNPGSAASALRNTRVLVAVFAVVTALVALDPPGRIVALTAFSGSLFAACFFPAIVLGLHWRRGNGAAVLASFGVGIATLFLWESFPLAGSLHEIFPAVALSTLVYASVAALTAVNGRQRVQRLFG